ncbi:hypothetical protein KUCAC02_025408, partial [Chaenocephalus aceratus]
LQEATLCSEPRCVVGSLAVCLQVTDQNPPAQGPCDHDKTNTNTASIKLATRHLEQSRSASP